MLRRDGDGARLQLVGRGCDARLLLCRLRRPCANLEDREMLRHSLGELDCDG